MPAHHNLEAYLDAYMHAAGLFGAKGTPPCSAPPIGTAPRPQKVVDRAMERDASAASAEYLGLFRSDLEALISREAVEACVDRGMFERAPSENAQYVGFVDPSGGSSDAMTAAVAHKQDGVIILDAVREVKPPFSPEAIAAELASFFLSYRVRKVRGDRYAGEWPREQFRKHGVDYETAAKPKSELFGELLPVINSRRAALLDDNRIVSQLTALERRTSRGGRDSIDHPRLSWVFAIASSPFPPVKQRGSRIGRRCAYVQEPLNVHDPLERGMVRFLLVTAICQLCWSMT